MSAAIYTARAGLDTLILEGKFTGGQMATTYEVDNYPAMGHTNGTELAEAFEKQAKDCGAKLRSGEVTAVDLANKTVTVGGETLTAKTIILAMGADPRMLDVPGEARLRGCGVSYCATCDGGFFRDMETAVVGGGNVAVEDALYLAKLCKKVYLIHRRDKLRADPHLQKAALQNPNITILWNTVTEEIEGADSVESLRLKNVVTGEQTRLAVSGVFIAVGTLPNTSLVEGQLPLERGAVITGDDMRTGVERVYACGDLRKKPLRQIITAAADGAIAGNSAILDLMEE